MTESSHFGDTIGAHQAKTHLSELLNRVDQGEAITITRHGSPIARLVPIRTSITAEQRRDAIQRWLETSQERSLDGLGVHDLIDAGRE